ncbi:MAG: GNAT family N-acetyltransferase [Bacteroidales bacterium]|nr:GNAT family N-acetyltransferase [Bacteroidales bacterium]
MDGAGRTICIRKAGMEDLPLIHNMAEVVFRHTYRDILSGEQMEYMMDWMYSLPNLERQLKEGHSYYVADIDGEPAGYVSIQSPETPGGSPLVFHLQKIYVMPGMQGQGLGLLLLEKAKEHVRSLTGGAPCRIELNVNRGNKAVGFYERMGFRILRQGDFPIGGGFYMNDYIMGLDI